MKLLRSLLMLILILILILVRSAEGVKNLQKKNTGDRDQEYQTLISTSPEYSRFLSPVFSKLSQVST